jgi:hypothetical protein
MNNYKIRDEKAIFFKGYRSILLNFKYPSNERPINQANCATIDIPKLKGAPANVK